MITRLWRRQEGSGLILLLAFMVLAVPIVTASLGLASTLSVDSRVKTAILKGQYSTLGGYEHGLYRLVHPPNNGYLQSLQPGVTDTYTLTVNGNETTVSLLKLSQPPGDVPPPSADSERGMRTFVTVDPAIGDPGVASTFTYTIRVENWSVGPGDVNKILNELPPGFAYATSSTLLNGSPFSDPASNGKRLTWDVVSEAITLPPQGVVTLEFQASVDATIAEGHYCDEAWIMPGGMKTSSGKTAIVGIGSPANGLCQGEAIVVSKTVDTPIAPALTLTTYTYTITLENIGTDALRVNKIIDRLPKSFTYVAGSTSGDFTTVDPAITTSQGQDLLDWNFQPMRDLLPGQTMVHAFQADAGVASGDYWNEAWIEIIEFPDSIYTWPTARVEVMGVFEITATDGKRSVFAEVWLGASSHVIGKLNVN